MEQFFQLVNVQRWDDHRYYHHSRVNQFLHLISALSFLVAYVFLFIDPVVSALVAWLVSMTTRQIGHFFFEPKGFDEVNQATHEHKEDIKVGYNLNRKIVLLSICAAIPVLAYWMPQYLQWAHDGDGVAGAGGGGPYISRIATVEARQPDGGCSLGFQDHH